MSAERGTAEVTGVFRMGDARVSDYSGERRISLGDSSFYMVASRSIFVDKSLLIKDVLDSHSKVTLFCRPRRFGKSLALSMFQSFFELPGDRPGPDSLPLFQQLAIWDVDEGAYRKRFASSPVINLRLASTKSLRWEVTRNAIAQIVAEEYGRHGYLESSDKLDEAEREYFLRMRRRDGDQTDLSFSLKNLVVFLERHHGTPLILLIDEYDAPILAAYTNGFYDETVDFMKRWLTGALKEANESFEFACLTGVQRIAKESIFSDLNNLVVDTPLDAHYEEGFGFTPDEVMSLATYLGRQDQFDEAHAWYDGYRFGGTEIYNPWSVLSYFFNDCKPGPYWGNTSSNSIVGDLIAHADDETLEQLYALMQPSGTVTSALDLSVSFPDLGIRRDAVWSMLFLSGYLTIDESSGHRDGDYGLLGIRHALRLLNLEMRIIFRNEIVERFARMAGSLEELARLQDALVEGNGAQAERVLGSILLKSASYHDLTSENSYHMLVMGLCFGIPGYENPSSNREAGHGRYDIQLRPSNLPGLATRRQLPTVTIEIKVLGKNRPTDQEAVAKALHECASQALTQISERDHDAPATQAGRPVMRWGLAFCGKNVAVARKA